MDIWNYKETAKYQEEHKRKIENRDAQFIVNKIARHFKLGKFRIYFYGYSDSGSIWYGGRIRLSNNPSFALICHELCHPLCKKRYKRRIRHGSKKWNYQLSRIVEYCKKQNFWENDLQRRKEQKKVRQEKIDEKMRPKTKEEIRGIKIQRIEQRVERYKKKIVSYQKRLKKAQRSLNALKRFQEKEKR